MHKGLKEPHLFNAASNPLKMINNLVGILRDEELNKIRLEIDRNVISLYRLGETHFDFACTVPLEQWRQRVSRLYYGAYNIRRAIMLKFDGTFSTDSSDHQKIEKLPEGLSNAATHQVRIKNLRDDRNLADYNHLATVTDLLLPPDGYQNFVGVFMMDSKSFLHAFGIVL